MGTATEQPTTDLQASAPEHTIGLDAVGITGLSRVIRVEGMGTIPARIDAHCSLAANQRGVHVSRFAQAADTVLDGSAGSLADLAATLAESIATIQESPHAEVNICAPWMIERTTPATGRPSPDRVELLARARVNHGTATAALGVRVWGMTACPCAQAMVADTARERLAAAGLDASTIDTVLGAIPMPSHNQRASATILVWAPPHTIDPSTLADLAWDAMSAPIHDVLKRPDELAVVLAAHERPMFVEDSVRRMLVQTAAALDDAPDAVVEVEQVNFESIHTHEVRARHSARVADLGH